MIKSLVVTNYLGDSITIELSSPEKSGFIVQSINGIGTAKANVNTVEMASNDGALFNSARVGTRNITLSLMFYETKTESIEDLRHKSYKFFPIKREVTLQINTDTGSRVIKGYVESNDPSIFKSVSGNSRSVSNNESTSISILCPNPYFKEVTSRITQFGTLERNFEFPFSNESLTEPLLEIGTVQYKTERLMTYTGDAETGIELVIHSSGNASNVSIFNTKTGESMFVDTKKMAEIVGSEIIKGDDIVISTIEGSKSATLVREGKSTNILNCINRDASWFKLRKGDNIFAFNAEDGAINLQFRYYNDVLYEGV